jgi:hypothetical protein
MDERMEFDKTVEWDKKTKFFKLYKKKDKNGDTFLTGEMTKTAMILIQPDKYDEKGETYNAFFVPVTYKKKEVKREEPKYAQKTDDDSTPF